MTVNFANVFIYWTALLLRSICVILYDAFMGWLYI